MKFYSKKGPILTVILFSALISLIVAFIKIVTESEILGPDLIGLVVIFLSIVLITWSWLQTYYEIHEEYLKIVAGPYKMKIKISEINKIQRTRNPLSSPALSLDRLEISYNKGDLAIISPKDKEIFCEKLRELNPDIVINLELKKIF